MKQFQETNTWLYVKFKLSTQEFLDTVKFMKRLDGARFNATKKRWEVLNTLPNKAYLLSAHFEEVDEFSDTPKQPVPIKQQEPIIQETPTPYADINKNRLPKNLYPYQIRGVQFLEAVKGMGMVLDEPGVGKTAQSLAYTALHPEIYPILIICPATLKLNWQREITKWLSEKSLIISGTDSYRIPKIRFVICNYDILSAWEETIRNHKFKLIIADEIQYISNERAQRTKAFKTIVKEIPQKIFLSGTPMKNNPGNFFTALSLIQPGRFKNKWQFQNKYMIAFHNGFGWSFKGSRNEKELHNIISAFSIRRTKKEVLPDLPDKMRVIVPFETQNFSEYKSAEQDFITWVTENQQKKLEGQKHMEILRQLAYAGKRNAVIEWIDNFLESGNKLVIFAYHLEVIKDLQKKFAKSCVVLYGETPAKDRQWAIDAFQTDPARNLFIGQINAAGVGITLTAAADVAFIQLPYTPADLFQAEDRIHRIGQKADKVTSYYLVAANTVEEDVAYIIEEKYKILGQILDGEEQSGIFNGKDFLEELAERLHKRTIDEAE